MSNLMAKTINCYYICFIHNLKKNFFCVVNCKEKRIYRYITKITFLKGASEITPCAKCYKIKF